MVGIVKIGTTQDTHEEHYVVIIPDQRTLPVVRESKSGCSVVPDRLENQLLPGPHWEAYSLLGSIGAGDNEGSDVCVAILSNVAGKCNRNAANKY